MRARPPTATGSSRRLANRDERLTNSPGEQPLEPEQRDERVVQSQRTRRNRLATQDAPGEPPSGYAGDVEVFDVSHVEAGVAHQGRETGALRSEERRGGKECRS